jgi:hypothetical protein
MAVCQRRLLRCPARVRHPAAALDKATATASVEHPDVRMEDLASAGVVELGTAMPVLLLGHAYPFRGQQSILLEAYPAARRRVAYGRGLTASALSPLKRLRECSAWVRNATRSVRAFANREDARTTSARTSWRISPSCNQITQRLSCVTE